MSVYKCGRCGKLVGKPLEKATCPFCDYCVLYKAKYFSLGLNKSERNILHYIGDNEPVSRKELLEDASTTQRTLDALKGLGLITVTRGRGHELTQIGHAVIRSFLTVKRVKSWEPGIHTGILTSSHGSRRTKHLSGEKGGDRDGEQD